jgi:hypothetical protein
MSSTIERISLVRPRGVFRKGDPILSDPASRGHEFGFILGCFESNSLRHQRKRDLAHQAARNVLAEAYATLGENYDERSLDRDIDTESFDNRKRYVWIALLQAEDVYRQLGKWPLNDLSPWNYVRLRFRDNLEDLWCDAGLL